MPGLALAPHQITPAKTSSRITHTPQTADRASVSRLKFVAKLGMPAHASNWTPKALLELTDEEREQLERWARRRKSSQALALRSRIVLGCADGLTNKEVAARVGVSRGDGRESGGAGSCELRLDGLVDEPRPGRPPTVTADQVEDVVVATLESTPENATHWSRAKMAERSRAVASPRSAGSGRRSTSSRTGPTGSSCPTTRCSWRRSTTSSGCT